MRIILSKHVFDKIAILRALGWVVTPIKIEQTIKKPRWVGTTRFGQETAMSLVDDNHILRVILNKEGDIIKVVTIHIARRGKYESTI